jgi:signal transduction histidine kinase
MGLGLGIIKNIIENYKGTITFETELGKGTTFFVSLPIVK